MTPTNRPQRAPIQDLYIKDLGEAEVYRHIKLAS